MDTAPLLPLFFGPFVIVFATWLYFEAGRVDAVAPARDFLRRFWESDSRDPDADVEIVASMRTFAVYVGMGGLVLIAAGLGLVVS
jgi:hypothetical protein